MLEIACNIGNNQPTQLMEYIEALEQALGKTARKNFLPIQPGDVPAIKWQGMRLRGIRG